MESAAMGGCRLEKRRETGEPRRGKRADSEVGSGRLEDDVGHAGEGGVDGGLRRVVCSVLPGGRVDRAIGREEGMDRAGGRGWIRVGREKKKGMDRARERG